MSWGLSEAIREQVQNWDQLPYRRHRAGNPADLVGKTLNSTPDYPFPIHPDCIKENTDRRWETWREIPYIEHTAVAQRKTCLITDTIDFCALQFCSSAPINYTGPTVGQERSGFPSFLPLKHHRQNTSCHKVTLNILCIFYSKHKKDYQTDW